MGNYRIYYLPFAILSLLYLIFSLMLPVDSEIVVRFGLDPNVARLLKITVILPYVIIWFLAFKGSLALKSYATSIKHGKDGKGLLRVAAGLYLLAVGLGITPTLSAVRVIVADANPSYTAALTIINNYVELAIGLAAFLQIYKGAQILLGVVKEQFHTFYEYVFIGLYMIIGVSYTYLTLTNPIRQFPEPGSSLAAFYLPDFLIVLTIIVPSLFMWFLGLSSAYCILRYKSQVKGLLYKKALKFLALGLLLIITSRIVMRYITHVSGYITGEFALWPLLLTLYGLLVLIGGGFVMVIRGVKNLKSIEKV